MPAMAKPPRRAVRAWGLEILCANPEEYSNALTAVMLPADTTPTRCGKSSSIDSDMSLGTGLGKMKGRIFRIGHLGDFNDLTLAGTLCGVEMGLQLAGVPIKAAGVQAALEYLANPGAQAAGTPARVRIA